ncbi:hypothetical protein QYE76_038375 [Lolium multiflorum]|uniref:Dirigent protein n=1 Tax=Lolium multiflorum TaxID=4521 RepID=A0AAD8T8Z5_LOLMU|nr:hypothetical protein QYE76_038375 [Lolium multiflorum]
MANPAYFTSAPVTQEIPQTELNFHLYMYQWMEGTPSGNEKRAVAVGGRNAFGSIYANDWTMYDGPDPNANLVARVQGVHTNCDMVLPDSWLVCASIVFVDQRFKGSTLKVVGNYGGGGVDEWAIVGGTGEFGFAQGVGTFKKFKEMDGNGNIREFNIRVRHPTPVLAPAKKVGPFGGDAGRDFDIPEQAQRVESVTIRSGSVIDSIAFSYVDKVGKKQTAGPWGGNGGNEETITFAPTETLTKVYGTTGTFRENIVVTSLTFITDLKAYPTFGNALGGTAFIIPEKEASVLGFFGRAGLWLDAIGAYYAAN